MLAALLLNIAHDEELTEQRLSGEGGRRQRRIFTPIQKRQEVEIVNDDDDILTIVQMYMSMK